MSCIPRQEIPRRNRPWLFPLLPLFLFFMGCSQSPTGSAALDDIVRAGYYQWGPLIEANLDLYEGELKRLNPYYEKGSRESITTGPQKVILSLMAMRKKDGVIVELGSWTGGGALLIAPHLTHDQSYHAVDAFNARLMPDPYRKDFLRGRAHLDVFRENIAPIKEKVVVHQGLTDDVAAAWPRDLAIDLLFIDADHSYKGVSADWRNWSPFVKKGGIIAFHDYYTDLVKYGHAGVRRFVDELIADKNIKDNFYSIEGLAWYIIK
jgi:predicted O-methyltransferase YrrM